MPDFTIDIIDKLILTEISKNPACSLSQLKVGLGHNAIKKRVIKMSEAGYVVTSRYGRIKMLLSKGQKVLDEDTYST